MFHSCTMGDLITYAIRILKAPISRRAYFLLSPPFMKKCTIFDKRRRIFLSLTIGSSSNYWTVSQVFHDQDYNIEHLRRFPEILNLANLSPDSAKRPLILDLGANIGASANFLSQEWPNAQVWCFEPSARNVEFLRLNATNNLKVFHSAVGGHDGFCVIENPSAEPDGFRITDRLSEDFANKIEMVSMQTLMSKIISSGGRPFILKIDIEGAEREVFQTASEWLEEWPVVMVELHDWMLPGSASSASVLKAFSDAKRDVVIVGSTLVSFSNKQL
jgi:FkbM family methyltransferase